MSNNTVLHAAVRTTVIRHFLLQLFC